MSREWKPGDVAMVNRLGKWVLAIRSEEAGAPWWFTAYGSGLYEGSEVRSLVVIDPEDPATIAGLAAALVRSGAMLSDGGVGHAYLATALREFADPKPPKPEEPTGLGAVVEDANGTKHVRTYFGGVRHAWLGYIADDGGERTRYWDDIDAVRILSDGLTP